MAKVLKFKIIWATYSTTLIPVSAVKSQTNNGFCRSTFLVHCCSRFGETVPTSIGRRCLSFGETVPEVEKTVPTNRAEVENSIFVFGCFVLAVEMDENISVVIVGSQE